MLFQNSMTSDLLNWPLFSMQLFPLRISSLKNDAKAR